MEANNKISYAAAGVNYNALDLVKRLAQQNAKRTSGQLAAHGMTEVWQSRGESAYVWEVGDSYWAFVVEGLGTKNLVADSVSKYSGKSHYDAIAQDTVAMIVNDLLVVGAQPLVVNAYFAVGDSDWFGNEQRTTDLIDGWTKACEMSGASWGGGETPTLKGIIEPQTIDLGGSCVGIIKSKANLVLGEKLAAGDAIVLIESNGIHANGLTLARTIAAKLPEGYQTKLSNGVTYGESLLRPTHIYVQAIQGILQAGLDIHYMVNVTGHGWRKLMRAERELSYVIEKAPEIDPLFAFIQEQSGNDLKEMYGNFNMGAGFAVFLPEAEAAKAVEIINSGGLAAWVAGRVETGPKQVAIKPHNITFGGESLEVR